MCLLEINELKFHPLLRHPLEQKNEHRKIQHCYQQMVGHRYLQFLVKSIQLCLRVLHSADQRH